jgi:hypothetical protein
LKAFPDGEHPPYEGGRSEATGGSSTTGSLWTAWPLFNRNYFWTFTPETIEQHGKTYHHLDPKEEIKRGMQLHYLAPNEMWKLEILDIVDKKGKSLEKADCNTQDIFIQTSVLLNGRENLYVEPTQS